MSDFFTIKSNSMSAERKKNNYFITLIDFVSLFASVIQLGFGIINAIVVAKYANTRDQYIDVWSCLLVACIIYIVIPIISLQLQIIQNCGDTDSQRIDEIIRTRSYLSGVKLFNVLHFSTIIIGIWAIVLNYTISPTHKLYVKDHAMDLWTFIQIYNVFGWMTIGLIGLVIDVAFLIKYCKYIEKRVTRNELGNIEMVVR